MPARVSEAIILRTYPMKEADLVVSFLTRDQGKLRGVAKRARRPKSAFGSGLERLSQVKMSYFQRETRELVNLDSCDLVHSQFALTADYAASVALDYLVEIADQLLPAAEPNERFFRLLMAVLEHLRSGEPGSVWRATTYFGLWAVRLSGILPELDVCLSCGAWLGDAQQPQRAFFTRLQPGLVCETCRRSAAPNGSWELSAGSRMIAGEVLRIPIGQLSVRDWSKETAADLRHFLVQQIEAHIERKLMTAPVLEAL
ncbi:MAG TPA: DNA repair protein RecO [Bryobacteraceae bacterium]|nr:DNA repair protein RecO [Bryobacteraceae bacterium]